MALVQNARLGFVAFWGF